MKEEKSKFIPLFLGAIIGFINGFFGGGGGMIAVPVLTGIFKYQQKKAHATSIAIILPICLASLIIYLSSGDLEFFQTFYIAMGVTAGGSIGAIVLKNTGNLIIEYLFDAVMLVAGIKGLFF